MFKEYKTVTTISQDEFNKMNPNQPPLDPNQTVPPPPPVPTQSISLTTSPKTPEVAHSMPKEIPATPGQAPKTPRTPGGKGGKRFYPVVKDTAVPDPEVHLATLLSFS